MFHKPIKIKDLSLVFPNKVCFENFNTQIYSGDHIAIIGRNGTGKSSLLQALQQSNNSAGNSTDITGTIAISEPIIFGYVPQIIEDFTSLSGGERFNKALTRALSLSPNILLLDEPTNHLDLHNRKSLMRMINTFNGTIIAVSHDLELLNKCFTILWHIDNGKIHIFTGIYQNYMQEIKNKRRVLEQELASLAREKKEMHLSLMKEQQRIAKSKASGQKKVATRRWTKSTGDLKAMKAEKTQGNKLVAIANKKHEIIQQLADLRLPEIIVPKFSLQSKNSNDTQVIAINHGTISYDPTTILLKNIHLSINAKEKIAIIGDNGSGKSTLIKAVLGEPRVIVTGDWCVPKREDIGYLDQHYDTLEKQATVFDSIQKLVPHWTQLEIRRHLTDFLFYSNEEINAFVYALSGGEKARLSLAQIAAKPPKLLILDEITNNLDLETIGYVIDVLSVYPGTMIIISHSLEFIHALKIKDIYAVDAKEKLIYWRKEL